MPRVKRGVPAHKKHKKILKLAEGHRNARHRLVRAAHESVMKALSYAYRDRRTLKRDMRKLWITRINAAARLHGLSYSQMIHGLDLAGVAVDRKVLADLAVYNGAVFGEIAAKAASALKAQQ
jgi:large subunit ribosomal protein L20